MTQGAPSPLSDARRSLLLLQRGGKPASSGPATDLVSGVARRPGEVLVCASCRHMITTGDQRIEVSGPHEQTRANPSGFVYTIRCFATAPGCRTIGTPTAEFTWFPPYAWQIACCRRCDEHLGWRFDSSAQFFYGLIAGRVIEKRDEPTD